METANNTLTGMQEKLDNARHVLFNSENKTERTEALAKIENIEKDLEKELAELRKSQDSLRKAVDHKRDLLRALDKFREENASQQDIPSNEEVSYDYEGEYDTDLYQSEPEES
jgi:signal transduction histidine kinase